MKLLVLRDHLGQRHRLKAGTTLDDTEFEVEELGVLDVPSVADDEPSADE